MRDAPALHRNTSNIIIVKGSSYSDGDQFHQHQQNEQLPLISLNTKTSQHVMLEIQLLA